MVRFSVAAAPALFCLLATSSSTSAFAPHRSLGSSTFVRSSAPPPPQRVAPAFAPNVPHSSSSRNRKQSVVSMNLFDRFTRVAKSNINSILKNLEDPEKIMNQALEDMQGDLVKVRQSYAEVTATQRRQLKQKEQASAVAEDWYKRAQLALQKGNEELAREALSRRQQNMDEAESLQQQIDFQAASIDKLYEGMQVLEKKIMESKSKKEQMVARARTAQSTQKVNDMLGGLTGKTSMDAFNRMEDKVEALEAAAEVSSEMGALTGSAPASLENEFKLLEGNASVEDEMRKLKGLLGSSSSTTEGSSASSTSSSSSSSPEASTTPPPAAPPTNSPEMDDEFEKLKKEAGL